MGTIEPFVANLALEAADPAATRALIDAACEQACRAIAPAWPLDRAIAVNPHWGRIGRPLRQVAARMAVLGAIQVFPTRAYLTQAWEEGRITPADLAHALGDLPAAKAAGLGVTQCIAALHQAPAVHRLPLLIDVLDDAPERGARLAWREAITHQVSQTCAAYFDQLQADWQPSREQGLYAFWRDSLLHDHGIGVLMGLDDLGRRLDALPATREDAELWAFSQLGLPEEVWADYLEAVLLTVNGWASWCAYLGWQAGLAGGSDAHLRELLAIRLAWGALLMQYKDDTAAQRAFAALRVQWCCAPQTLRQAEDALLVDEVWQLALEAGYQRQLSAKLSGAAGASQLPRVAAEVQAAFCIDVRSEPMRRALESLMPSLQTVGFAGFFGLPVAYTPLATAARRPQLPGLLAPALDVKDSVTESASDAGCDTALDAAASAGRHRNFVWSEQWAAATRWPGAAFSYVEAAGAGYLGKLAGWLRPSAQPRARDDLAGLPTRYRALCRPALGHLSTADKVDLAAKVLHAMGLEQGLAPLVLLVGHGGQTVNNAHAAGLDCGACCGQTGEVNARVLARMLNEQEVRGGLRSRGLAIPQGTTFVAALHNTTTDEIEGFDLDLLNADARARWDGLQPVLAAAGHAVRRERAPSLGVDAGAGQSALLDTLRRRASDGAQTRPEWALAGNAAFVIAPRERTRGLQLDGRSFLHDYDAAQDSDGSVLELLMTAPMLVTHWINWQYHASTCDPQRLGSGNKVLHNIVGGQIGVFEGNGGDLRIGLSYQSLNNGSRWIHEPLRLTVVIDAPRAGIDAIIAKHAVVQQLLDHGWLHLWRFEGDALQRHTASGWQAVDFGTA
ncbi:MAG: DUF2309 domain-containing protein [Rhodocyclaceae bacterium]|nr:DUF2309 domain-containing protein [Rhodocyclaceae bacterium]